MRKELDLNELNTVAGGVETLAFNSHPIHEWTAPNDTDHFSSVKAGRHNIRAPLTDFDYSIDIPVSLPGNKNNLAPDNFHKRLTDSIPQIKPCTFEGNHAPSSGGALKFD